jgi:ribosomal protein L37AE/L43A|tara:strand:- start:14443 stop:14637 length:195 start_codon:yes stop_codon:yes gene_type:complete
MTEVPKLDNTYCDLCDTIQPTVFKEDGVWSCVKCDEKYPTKVRRVLAEKIKIEKDHSYNKGEVK